MIGLYPMLPDETCFLLVLDFDDADWQACATAVAQVCRTHTVPFALERSRLWSGSTLMAVFLPRQSHAPMPGVWATYC